mmetsp:Transcript_17452/g.40725  ORF Transcript_17452/g.40725 Transcript_17452/m.40725 type:complete len:87 (-) Transcript_17452:303-563(-)
MPTFAPGTKTEDGTSSKPPAAAAAASSGSCLYCKQTEALYETENCGHLGACKKCAMKTATGGKCKVCGQLFPNWRRKSDDDSSGTD